MSSNTDLWERLAAKLEEGMHEDLRGGRTWSAARQRGAAMRTRRGVVRTRGAVQEADQPAVEPWEQVPVVIVEVPKYEMLPSEEQVKHELQERMDNEVGDIDLYYVVRGRHWAALGPRELNPDNAEYGNDHHLFLRSLKPEYVLLPSGQERPSWCGEETPVIEWQSF